MIPIIEKLKSRISTLEEKSAITGALITNYTITTGISATTFETIPVKNLITSKGKAFSITEEGEKLSDKYDRKYYSELSKYLDHISEEEADCMISTIKKLYQVMCERRIHLE